MTPEISIKAIMVSFKRHLLEVINQTILKEKKGSTSGQMKTLWWPLIIRTRTRIEKWTLLIFNCSKELLAEELKTLILLKGLARLLTNNISPVTMVRLFLLWSKAIVRMAQRLKSIAKYIRILKLAVLCHLLSSSPL